ncbi:MAG: hypothetical protein FWG68_01425 [Defluviitaleaceae bacterium]|nr:hypothetical protein [Defluviitaleaceae bacterium]
MAKNFTKQTIIKTLATLAILAITIATIAIWRTTTTPAAPELSEHLTQIMELIPIIQERNQNQPFDPVAFNANFGVIMPRTNLEDERLNRLVELDVILIEAKFTVDIANGIDRSPMIIASFSEPTQDNPIFSIFLLSEEYLPLADFIAEFMEIPQNELKIEIMGNLPNGERWRWGFHLSADRRATGDRGRSPLQ